MPGKAGAALSVRGRTYQRVISGPRPGAAAGPDQRVISVVADMPNLDETGRL